MTLGGRRHLDNSGRNLVSEQEAEFCSSGPAPPPAWHRRGRAALLSIFHNLLADVSAAVIRSRWLAGWLAVQRVSAPGRPAPERNLMNGTRPRQSRPLFCSSPQLFDFRDGLHLHQGVGILLEFSLPFFFPPPLWCLLRVYFKRS